MNAIYRRGVEIYYTAELAFYGASTFMLLFWEERRHDFPVMLTHHVVTICLIAFSYLTRSTPPCLLAVFSVCQLICVQGMLPKLPPWPAMQLGIPTWLCRFTRIGAVVMFLHDPSDIFLDAAKLSQYLGHESTATMLFVLLLVTWFVARLVVLPFWLIRSAM